ncbi:MAG: DUF6331 family protein [Porticoccus sp.]|jgi:hypothetical protein|uniref:DUF6331 family protein n=1 Tax=Porticoccus sp. TaxID=2024853 RepID=UPI003296A9F9
MVKRGNEPEFHKLVIPQPLWEFLTFCEVYCSAACCEDSAFEQHHSLIRRKIIDMNIANQNGQAQFDTAFKKIKDLNEEVKKLNPKTENDQLLVFVEPNTKVHEFQLNLDITPAWFSNWVAVFDEIANPKPVDEND